MMKVSLTGGLGSGKTTVAKHFEKYGIPVFYADEEAKKITDESQEVKDALIKEFGEELYAGGKLNKPLLASIIFNDNVAIKTVNNIIHPAVKRAFDEWASRQNSSYVIEEAAIVFETGGYKFFDQNILVSAPKEMRIERVMKRSGWTREETLSRMKNQWDESHKLPLADFVILNDGTRPLEPQISEIHENLLRIANQGG